MRSGPAGSVVKEPKFPHDYIEQAKNAKLMELIALRTTLFSKASRNDHRDIVRQPLRQPAKKVSRYCPATASRLSPSTFRSMPSNGVPRISWSKVPAKLVP